MRYLSTCDFLALSRIPRLIKLCILRKDTKINNSEFYYNIHTGGNFLCDKKVKK